MARTRHTRIESRVAVQRVLMDVWQAKNAGKKFTLANLCSKYNCGNINGAIIAAMDFSKVPEYADAVAVLKANSDYKRSCNVGTRKSAKQALADARSESDIQADERAIAEKLFGQGHRENESQPGKKSPDLSGLDLQPDPSSLFPEQSLIPKAIAICQRAGYIVSRPL